MNKTFIRMLSTGRTGTKFVAAVFSDQGYRAFHENLYHGEPGSAVIQYVRMLGDLWVQDKEKYYALDSDFARPYLDAVLKAMEPENNRPRSNTPRTWIRDLFFHKEPGQADHFIIHSGHRLTTATPIIEKEAAKREVATKTLILFRNPLKTIHALYMVESAPYGVEGPYRMRPSAFFSDGTYLGAADIWANTYLMAHDQSGRLANGGYRLLNLERFSRDVDYVAKLFDFLGLAFHENRFKAFAEKTLERPLRASKVDSPRNSHIFHDPSFVFSDEQIENIYDRTKSAVELYDLNWEEVVDEYRVFHEHEKLQIGFS